ncbi:hypothetical protein [Tenacibaculum sp.]|uniref:hypothetical protein n=1 Tax=Tenacibaculum sp. TaxID=1906242 RepID=UPI003D11D73C
MKQNKETLKKFFETGDKPTQQQYADLIDSYIDVKQLEGEANRRFVIDELGEVSVASEQQIPEYILSPISGTNTVDLLKDGVSVSQIDLTPYLDNTNLARLVSGTVDVNGVATFTRDDNSTFTVDLSNLKDNLTLQKVTDEGAITDNAITLTSVDKDTLILDSSSRTTGNEQCIRFKGISAQNDYTIGIDPNYQDGSPSQYSIFRIGEQFLDPDNGEHIGWTPILEIANSRINIDALTTFEKGLGIRNSNNSSSSVINITPADDDSFNVRTLTSPKKSGTLALTNDIPQIQAGSNITIDTTDPLQPIINATTGSGGTTNLSYDAATRTVASSTGTDAVLPLADTTNAGLMKANFYEEGTFTPTLNTSGATYTTGSKTGHYVRLGNLVYYHVNIFINGDTIGTPTSSLYIDGLPFVNNVFPTPGTVGNFSASDVSESRLSKLSSVVSGNSNKIYFQILDESNLLSNVIFTGNGTIRVKGTYKTNVYTP